jgi:hypothetical protein
MKPIPRFLLILILLLSVLNLLDIAITEVSLNNGFIEANPIPAFFFSFGILGRVFIYAVSGIVVILAPILIYNLLKKNWAYLFTGVMIGLKLYVIITGLSLLISTQI